MALVNKRRNAFANKDDWLKATRGSAVGGVDNKLGKPQRVGSFQNYQPFQTITGEQLANGSTGYTERMVGNAQALANQLGANVDPNDMWAYGVSQMSANQQMDFESYMSSTAHQREVADLQKAGLNPVLSANGGASTPSGSSTQATDAMTSAMMQTKAQISAQKAINKAQLENAYKIAKYQMKVQQKMNKYSTDQNYALGLYQANLGYKSNQLSAGAMIKSAQLNHDATVTASQLSADASKFASRYGYKAKVYTTDNQNMTYKIDTPAGGLTITMSRREYDSVKETIDNWIANHPDGNANKKDVESLKSKLKGKGILVR